MCAQRFVELGGDGVGHTALTDAHDRLAVMGTGTEEETLVTREHREGSTVEEGASLSPVHREALASIKRELAAIVGITPSTLSRRPARERAESAAGIETRSSTAKT